MDEDPLALSPDEMRDLGHRMVDMTIERMSTGRPGLGHVGRDDTEARIDGAPPEEPVAIDELLARLDAATELMARSDHRVTSSGRSPRWSGTPDSPTRGPRP